MLDIQALIDHLNAVAADPNDARLPTEWSAHWAWTMAPVDAEDLPASIPLVAFYQGSERWSKREGSPCHQTAMPSVLVALVICDKRQQVQRLNELRSVLYGWQAPGDRLHGGLYLSDEPGLPCDALDIRGDYLWWQDNWFTTYAITST